MSTPDPAPMPSCEDLLRAMNSFVDGDTASPKCRRFAAHLANCPTCQVVVDNIRQTITIYRDGVEVSLPADFQSCLRETLRRRWAERVAAKTGSGAPPATP